MSKGKKQKTRPDPKRYQTIRTEDNGVSPYQNEAWKIDGLKVFLFNNKADPNKEKEGGWEEEGLILLSNFSLLNHNVPIPGYNFPVLYDIFQGINAQVIDKGGIIGNVP